MDTFTVVGVVTGSVFMLIFIACFVCPVVMFKCSAKKQGAIGPHPQTTMIHGTDVFGRQVHHHGHGPHGHGHHGLAYGHSEPPRLPFGGQESHFDHKPNGLGHGHFGSPGHTFGGQSSHFDHSDHGMSHGHSGFTGNSFGGM